MHLRKSTILLLGLACAAAHGQSSAPDLKALAATHRWAELRDVAGKDKQDKHGAFYSAVAAAVFNEPRAEALFQSVIHDDPQSEEAYQSYDWLGNIYLKSGRYRSLAAVMQARWTAFPNKKGVASEKKDLTPFLGLPDQVNGPLRVSTLRHDAHSFGVSLTINHKRAKFFFDDGADFSCISELEAKRLGMEVREAKGTMGTMTRDASFRTAIAHNVTIGGMHFKEVSFAVFSDDQEPWSLTPLGSRGIIGLPLMVAVGTFHWRADGTLTIGGRPKALDPQRSNLFMDGGKHPILKAEFQGQDIWTALDTGAMTTDVYATFAQRFPEYLKENGTPGQNEIRGLGGVDTVESINVPELPFEVGGRDVVLRPAYVYTKRSERRDWILLNLGKDLLTQTSGFTIDFRAMTLMLQAP